MKSYSFVLPYPLGTGNTAVRHTKSGGHYISEEAGLYRALVRTRMIMLGLDQVGVHYPIHIDYYARPPDLRDRDADNLEKVVNDALKECGFLKDDCNKIIRSHTLVWLLDDVADESPLVDITIRRFHVKEP